MVIRWPGRPGPGAIARQYLRIEEVEQPLPADLAGISLLSTDSVSDLPSSASGKGSDVVRVEKPSNVYTLERPNSRHGSLSFRE
jgi:hypothetical protein